MKEQNSYFYHGENISDYELVQTAVALGKMELPTDEKKCNPDRAVKEAFEVLVRDQAAPQNSWSNTLYSEDGKYTFTKTENGRWQMHLLDDVGMEASVEDIANWMMSGTPNRNIETRYLNYLHTVDPDLYNVAMRIGMEVRTYDFMEDMYSPDEAKSLDKLREQQYKHGGIV